MRIKDLYLRRFRSAHRTSLEKCGGLNVLIGKNNAGKSNLLAAIELTLRHLKSGTIAGFWHTHRPIEEFTDHNTEAPIQIGVVFESSENLNAELMRQLAAEAPHLEKAVERVGEFDSVSVIVSGALTPRSNIPFLYVSEIGMGIVDGSGDELAISGIPLLKVRHNVALQLFEIQQSVSDLKGQMETIRRVGEDRNYLNFAIREKIPLRGAYIGDTFRQWPELLTEVDQLIRAAADADEAALGLRQIIAKKQDAMTAMLRKETQDAFGVFAGDTKIPPRYIGWLMNSLGGMRVIYFREDKQKIGTEEANLFVRMKVRRGGPEQLNAIQQTIRELLGVHVDAFQPDEGRQPEMDVDQFLVDANGAGIREALRIILDLELKEPELVLIEEPESHLHPGLEHVVASYLRTKSADIQMFVTTHSTEFVDSVAFQNAYLVSKLPKQRTVTQLIEASEGALRIPREIGLRLSSVFMYDRLVFVEGPSDEAVLREFARKLDVDLTKNNVGFVHMLGVRNFAHYAAEATLDLLSKRRVRMWFIADRDEKDDDDVERMMQRLGENAKLHVLCKRELENYLINPRAITEFIRQKRRTGKLEPKKLAVDDVIRALEKAADALKAEVIRLRVEKEILTPVFLQTRKHTGDMLSRLKTAMDELQGRVDGLQTVTDAVNRQLDAAWSDERLSIAPGAAILDHAIDSLGASFSKDRGDSELLACCFNADDVPKELRDLLADVVDDDASEDIAIGTAAEHIE